jgi:hypothetical protein
MTLSGLLELLYSASERSRTVQATVERWTDQRREVELLRARGWYRDPPPIPAEEGEWGMAAARVEATTRIWAAQPYWLRWETSFSHDGVRQGAFVGVKEGELFWHRFGDGEVQSNEQREGSGTMSIDEERLLDPAPLLGLYCFAIGEETVRLGREAVHVAAKRRSTERGHDFGPLADELDLIVDCERGVLLRVGVVVDGEELSAIEVAEVVFDEAVPPRYFGHCANGPALSGASRVLLGREDGGPRQRGLDRPAYQSVKSRGSEAAVATCALSSRAR